MKFSNDILGKSIVAVIYKNYRTSLHALDYVTKVDKFSLKGSSAEIPANRASIWLREPFISRVVETLSMDIARP